MNREQLKQMWFNLPTNNVVTRTIKLEMDKMLNKLSVKNGVTKY